MWAKSIFHVTSMRCPKLVFGANLNTGNLRSMESIVYEQDRWRFRQGLASPAIEPGVHKLPGYARVPRQKTIKTSVGIYSQKENGNAEFTCAANLSARW